MGARAILAAVRSAEKRVQKASETFPIYVGLLADLTIVMGEQAKSAMDRTYDLVNDALACCRSRTPEENKELASAIRKPLIKKATYHGATLGPDAAKEGPDAAKELGLPVADADLDGQEWKTIWALWTRYFSVGVWPEGRLGVYEGELASQIIEYAS